MSDPSRPLSHGEMIEALERRLATRRRRTFAIDGYRRAAVAVLLRGEGDRTMVPLIVRPGAMRAHAGQIALPGGTRDEADDSFEACALREAEEELGVPLAQMRVVGLLDDVPTPTGFVITPVVAELGGAVVYRPNPDEVAALFEAPLEVFADPTTAEDMGEREHWGTRYRLRAYVYGEHRVWGATARVLEALHEALAGT